MPRSTQDSIKVGLSTVAGLSTATAAYIAALTAAVMGDRSEETITAVGVGTVALVAVIVSRTKQALEQIYRAPRPLASGGVSQQHYFGTLAPALVGERVGTPTNTAAEVGRDPTDDGTGDGGVDLRHELRELDCGACD